MTKQPRSGTKLRLFKLFHCLAVLCFIKLCILGVLLLDLPLPSWLGGENPQTARQEQTSPHAPDSRAQNKATHPDATSAPTAVQQPSPYNESPVRLALNKPPVYSDSEHAPQGAEAARLAATARPRTIGAEPLVDAALPAPLIRAGLPQEMPGFSGNGSSAEPIFTQHLPTPEALPAPVAQPGTPTEGLLLASATPKRADESDWLDFLGLRRLPVPGLGSVQAAHAAALDMPTPQMPRTPTQTSAFAPQEQGAPLTLPGAPPMPSNIPRGQSSDGAPLPQRSAASSAQIPPLTPPQTGMPVPRIERGGAALGHDANAKAQELSRQEQDILMLRQQMDQRLKDMQNTEQKMQDMIREAKGLENEKVKRMILTYSNMKPKAAAKALEQTDERVAIRILSGMTPKQAGEIMTHMDATKTAKLTELVTRMRISD